LVVLLASRGHTSAQPFTFAGNAQHTGIYGVPAQPLNRVIWSTKIDLNNSGGYVHYGAPVITAANTVIVPVRTTNGFKVNAFEAITGRLKYTLPTDYVGSTNAGWSPPVYQPALAVSPAGARLYYPGAGGTVYYIDDPDSDSPGAPARQCFYTDLATYTTNAAAFNSSVFIDTPLTPGPDGAVFFGFATGTNGSPMPFGTNQGGFVRLHPSGNAIYVFATTASGDAQTAHVEPNSAPAVASNNAALSRTEIVSA